MPRDDDAPATDVAAAPAPAPEPTPAAAPASRFDAIVDLWFAECIQGTEIGRITPAYNAAFAAKEELKQRLAKEN